LKMDSFYMVAASNASTDVYPQNTLVSFKNQLLQDIDVTDYKIALQSIFLDNKYGNIPNNILGTRNHFQLFLGNRDSFPNPRPIATCDITDYAMQATTFVVTVTKELSAKEKGKFRMILTADKKLEIQMRNSVLWVHKEVNKCFKFNSTDTIEHRGETYTRLDSASGVKVFHSENVFPAKPITPLLIKVQLEQMCQNLSDLSFVQDLAVLKATPKTYPFYSVCKRKEYFALNCGRLNTLSLRLVDENNWPLHLGIGQPTFLKLQLKKFAMKSLVLRLSSLESKSIFSDNKSSSFRIQLQQPICTSSWDVALSSICLPSKINYASVFTPDNFYLEISKNNVVFEKIILHDITDFSPQGFITHCHAALPSPRPFDLSLDENNEIYIECKMDIKMNISGLLAYMLSFATLPDTKPSWPFPCEKGNKRSLGKLNYKRKLHPQTALLYCNFTAPIVIGNTFGQVLQLIPFYDSDINGDVIMKHEAQHLDFVALRMNDKTTMQFEIRDSSGNLINFKDNNTEILLTLVFREKM